MLRRVKRKVREIIDRVYKRPPREAFEKMNHPYAKIMSHSAEFLERLSREARRKNLNDDELRLMVREFLGTKISRKEAESILNSLTQREVNNLIFQLYRLRKQYEDVGNQLKSVSNTARFSQEILLDLLNARDEKELEEKIRALEGASEAIRLKGNIARTSYDEWLEAAKELMRLYLELLRKRRR